MTVIQSRLHRLGEVCIPNKENKGLLQWVTQQKLEDISHKCPTNKMLGTHTHQEKISQKEFLDLFATTSKFYFLVQGFIVDNKSTLNVMKRH